MPSEKHYRIALVAMEKAQAELDRERRVSNTFRQFIYERGLSEQLMWWTLNKHGVGLGQNMIDADLYGPPEP